MPRSKAKENRLPSAIVIEETISRRFKARRKALGISQTTMGEALGVSFQQVQKYENLSNRISVANLLLAASILRVPLTYFFEGADISVTLPEGKVIPDQYETLLEDLSKLPKAKRNIIISIIHDLALGVGRVDTPEIDRPAEPAHADRPVEPVRTDHSAEMAHTAPKRQQAAPKLPAQTMRRIRALAGRGLSAAEIAADVMLPYQTVDAVLANVPQHEDPSVVE